MDKLLHKYGGKIKGVIEGFDRIVFKGTLRPLCFALGMQVYLSRQSVLNKDYKDWILNKSAVIIQDAKRTIKTGNRYKYPVSALLSYPQRGAGS